MLVHLFFGLFGHTYYWLWLSWLCPHFKFSSNCSLLLLFSIGVNINVLNWKPITTPTCVHQRYVIGSIAQEILRPEWILYELFSLDWLSCLSTSRTIKSMPSLVFHHWLVITVLLSRIDMSNMNLKKVINLKFLNWCNQMREVGSNRSVTIPSMLWYINPALKPS